METLGTCIFLLFASRMILAFKDFEEKRMGVSAAHIVQKTYNMGGGIKCDLKLYVFYTILLTVRLMLYVFYTVSVRYSRTMERRR